MRYMPSVDVPKYHLSEDKKKINSIIYFLNGLNYGVGTARDTVKVIEEKGVDKFDFDYPYGSFEEYKKHVLAGEFDRDLKSVLATPEQEARFNKAIDEGKV